MPFFFGLDFEMSATVEIPRTCLASQLPAASPASRGTAAFRRLPRA